MASQCKFDDYVSSGGSTPNMSQGATIASGKTLTTPSVTLNSGTNQTALAGYREGTWTPSIKGVTSGTAASVTTNATYTRIGRLVFVHAEASFTTGTISGSLKVQGLPYTVASAGGPVGDFGAVVVGTTGFTLASATGMHAALRDQDTDGWVFKKFTSAGNSVSVSTTNSDLGGGTMTFSVDAWYVTSDAF
jgi:hypothetical protein